MYTEQVFQLRDELPLSQEQIQVHLALYAGYVKNTNMLLEKIASWQPDWDQASLSELQRRLGFEFDGMRMHEYYFRQLEGQAQGPSGAFADLVMKQWGSVDRYFADIKRIGMMRGIGWVVTYYDTVSDMLINTWVSDHELGQLAGLPVVFALDMWEHAFMVDYRPATKGEYIDAYLSSVDWNIVSERI